MSITNTYKAALFDLDGTLINSTRAIVSSTLAALDELDWEPVPEAVIIAHIGYKLEAIFPERNFDERKGLINAIGRHYDGICGEQTELYPGVDELLSYLKENRVPMAVVTSKRRGHTETILAALGVREHFSVVIGSDDVTRMKPDPEGLNRAVSTLGLAAEHCLYVGDTRVDIETAHGAGVAVAGVAWGTDGAEKLAEHGSGHDRFHPIGRPEALYPLFGVM
jgi:2-phosphoglycolate phosphatase